MKRQIIAEYLDTDSGTPAEIQGSLTDLRRANQWFGGIPTTQAMIQRVAQASHSSSLSLLEVAAGSSNVPESVSTRLSRRGLSLEVTLLDRAHTHLNSSARSMVGDALAIPCLDNSFDIVSCTLFAHHLGPADIVRFVNEGLRVARKAVLINDLIRDPVGTTKGLYAKLGDDFTAEAEAGIQGWVDDNPQDRAQIRRELSRDYEPLEVDEISDAESLERALGGGRVAAGRHAGCGGAAQGGGPHPAPDRSPLGPAH